jgi:integrase
MLEQWATHLRRQRYSPRTVQAMTAAVAAIARGRGVLPEELTAGHVQAYLDEHHLADWSYRKYVEHVRAYCAWVGIPDATEGMRCPPCPKGVPRPCTITDLERLCAAADPVLHAQIMLGAGCGMRAFEVAKARRADFYAGPDSMVVRVLGKGAKLAVVPVPARVWALVETLGSPLWPATNSAQLRMRFKRLADRTGVEVTFHMLRHYYGTACYRATGESLLATQQLMRHSSPASTAGYALVASSRLTQAVARLNFGTAA